MAKLYISDVTNVVLKEWVERLIPEVGKRYGIEVALLRAIVEKESGGYPFAVRYEPGLSGQQWFQDTVKRYHLDYDNPIVHSSIGPAQILTVICYNYGAIGIPNLLLGDVKGSLGYGAQHLLTALKRYKGDIRRAVSAYNAGHDTDTNYDSYVEPVMAYYQRFLKEPLEA